MENKTGHNIHGSDGEGTQCEPGSEKLKPSEGEAAVRDEGKGLTASCVIDVSQEGEGHRPKEGVDDDNDGEVGRLCRVCHLGSDSLSGQSEFIHLGCGCADSLGFAHKRCAEAWFVTRGRKDCEICGLDAKNVSGVADWNFILDWNDQRACPEEVTPVPIWRRQPFCAILLLVTIICLVFLWVFHVGI